MDAVIRLAHWAYAVAARSHRIARRTLASIAGQPAPAAVAPRITALFVFLAFTKFVNVFSHPNELVETHWRVSPPHYTPFGWVNFAVFTLIAAAVPPALFPPQVRRDRTAAGRFLFAWLVFSFLFAVLNLHSGTLGYLSPWIEGIITIGDIRSRLFLDFTDRPPYLILFLAASMALYAGLITWRRLEMLPTGLGLISAAYLWINLRELAALGNRLFFLNVWFIGWYVVVRRLRNRLGASRAVLTTIGLWMYFAFSGTAVFLMFRKYLWNIEEVQVEFAVILAVTLVLALWMHLYLRDILLKEPYRYTLLPFPILLFALFCIRLFPQSLNYANLLIVAFTMPCYGLEELIVCLVLLGVVRRCKQWTWSRRLLLDGVCILLAGLWAADLMVTRVMGVRLDWRVLTLNNEPGMLYRTIRPFLPAFAVLLGLFAAAYTLAILWPRLPARIRRRTSGAPVVAALAGSFVVLACARGPTDEPDKFRPGVLSRLIASSPIAARLHRKVYSPEDFVTEWKNLGFPTEHRTAPSLGPPPKHVLLIFLESCYNAYLSLFGAPDETQPRLKRFLDRMEVYPNFYSVFASSLHARFATLSGLYTDKGFISYENPRIPQKGMIEILHEQGFHVAFFDSCDRDYTRWYDYLRGRGIDEFYDRRNLRFQDKYRTLSWGMEERCTVANIIDYFRRRAHDEARLFTAYFPVAPHFPFDAGGTEFNAFSVGAPTITGDYSGAYKNDLLYIDAVLADLLGFLRDTDLLDQTLIVITNDHGEMLGDREHRLGHGWNLAPYLTNVPLIIMDPRRKGYRVNMTPSAQVDILPTVLDLLDIPLPEDDLYQGVSLLTLTASEAARRPIYLNSFGDRALIENGMYYLWHASRSDGRPVECFRIQHKGTRTIFGPAECNRPDVTSLLQRFETFQEALIQDYTRYRPLAPRIRAR